MNGSILIYDPDEFTREALKKTLCARFPLIVVEDRAQCLDALQQTAPLSLAFLSVLNEDGDADLDLFDAARKLRKGLTLIALGDSGLEDLAVKAVKHGASGYMLKPLREEDVLATAVKADPGR